MKANKKDIIQRVLNQQATFQDLLALYRQHSLVSKEKQPRHLHYCSKAYAASINSDNFELSFQAESEQIYFYFWLLEIFKLSSQYLIENNLLNSPLCLQTLVGGMLSFQQYQVRPSSHREQTKVGFFLEWADCFEAFFHSSFFEPVKRCGKLVFSQQGGPLLLALTKVFYGFKLVYPTANDRDGQLKQAFARLYLMLSLVDPVNVRACSEHYPELAINYIEVCYSPRVRLADKLMATIQHCFNQFIKKSTSFQSHARFLSFTGVMHSLWLRQPLTLQALEQLSCLLSPLHPMLRRVTLAYDFKALINEFIKATHSSVSSVQVSSLSLLAVLSQMRFVNDALIRNDQLEKLNQQVVRLVDVSCILCIYQCGDAPVSVVTAPSFSLKLNNQPEKHARILTILFYLSYFRLTRMPSGLSRLDNSSADRLYLIMTGLLVTVSTGFSKKIKDSRSDNCHPLLCPEVIDSFLDTLSLALHSNSPTVFYFALQIMDAFLSKEKNVFLKAISQRPTLHCAFQQRFLSVCMAEVPDMFNVSNSCSEELLLPMVPLLCRCDQQTIMDQISESDYCKFFLMQVYCIEQFSLLNEGQVMNDNQFHSLQRLQAHRVPYVAKIVTAIIQHRATHKGTLSEAVEKTDGLAAKSFSL